METKQNLLPVLELFKKSFDVYWRKKWKLAGIVLFGLIGMVPVLILGGIAFAISFWPFSHSDYNVTLILVDILLALIGIFFAIFFGLWSRTALFFAASREELDVKNALKTGWAKIASFFWIGLLVGLASLGGFILFVIPGIIFSIWFSLSSYFFVTEDVRGVAALKRSKQLVKGYWWPVFGRLMLIFVIALLVSWIRGLGSILNMFFVAPFSVVFLYELFLDLKRVKD